MQAARFPRGSESRGLARKAAQRIGASAAVSAGFRAGTHRNVSLEMGERAVDSGSPQRPGEYHQRKRKQHEREGAERGDLRP